MSYAEKAARERLALLNEQTKENIAFQSALSRKVKNLKRKDFEQQIQPLYTQVEFKGGPIQQPVGERTAWGKFKGGGFKKSVERNKIKGISEAFGGASPTVTGGGSMNVLQQSQQWTTEGYRDIGQVENSIVNPIKRKLKSKTKQARGWLNPTQFLENQKNDQSIPFVSLGIQ